MGSFDVGCIISNLAIHEGDRAGFFILKKNPYPSGRDREDAGAFSYYIYNTDEYTGYLPPVFGTYADYGDLDNIDESITTRVLEEKFRRPVKTVLDVINCSGGVYSKYGEIYKTYNNGGNHRIHEYEIDAETALLSIGFSIVPGTDLKTYEFKGCRLEKHEHSNYDQWRIIDLNNSGDSLIPLMGSSLDSILDEFAAKTGLYPGFPEEDWEIIRELQSLGGTYFLEEVLLNMKKWMDDEQAQEYKRMAGYDDPTILERTTERSRESRWIKLMEGIRAHNASEETFALWTFTDEADLFKRNSGLNPEDYHLLGEYIDDKNEWNAFFALLDSTHRLNRMLIPSFCGEQMGNDRASIQLNAITGAILDERKHDWEYEEDDEDD